MWLPIFICKNTSSTGQAEMCFLFYLLIITTIAIIKANAIMANKIFVYNDNINNCIITFCTIRTTSLSM